MTTILEVKNIDYISSEYLEGVNGPKHFEVAILEELDQQQWNTLAKKTNVRTFAKAHGRFPINYEEVQGWMNQLFPSLNKVNNSAIV